MIKDNSEYLKIHSKIKYFIFLCLYFLLFPIAKLMFGKRNNWLICERGYDAQDNGFIFYKYLVDNHPEINATFLVKKTSPEFEKVSKVGRVIEFGSLKHFLMVIGYPVKISSHLFGYAPWNIYPAVVEITIPTERYGPTQKHQYLFNTIGGVYINAIVW